MDTPALNQALPPEVAGSAQGWFSRYRRYPVFSAPWVRTITSTEFAVPTTVARFGKRLYLPNARFGITDPTTADYWITQVRGGRK